MNKRQIQLLSVFITIITLLLIVVQVLWIGNAKESKQKDFDAVVSIALERVIDAVSRQETYIQVIDKLPSDISPSLVDNDTSLSSYSEKQTSREGIRYTRRNQELIPFAKLDSFAARNKTISQINDSSLREFLNKGSNSSNTTQTGDKINKNALNQKMVMVEQIIERIFMLDIPIEQRVTIEQVDSLLKNELLKSDIKANFEIAIISENNIPILSSTNYSLKAANEKDNFQKQLFPNDPKGVEKFYLKLYFPEQNYYILRSLWVLITASILLTILILITFIATLLIIAKQKKAAEIRNAFVSNITHEFKTPIATISLAAQMLKDPNIPVTSKDVPNLSEMVFNQSNKLTFLVEQILQMSIFNKGDYELKKSNIDVHEIIKKALNNFDLQIENLNAKLACDFKAHDTIIYSDELHYTNVISNLIDNALKYSDGIPNLKITTVNKDNGILVSLSDNGIGISKEYQKRIFEQFFRVPSGNVHNVKGFGLGLSYVKKLVDVMGGRIWLNSELNKGSTFFVWMPLKDKTFN